jgi:protein-S-isoprenylcysteine O-methyltransferase Ste14
MAGTNTMNTRRIAGTLAYGALFVIIIPALLILWARAMDRVTVDLPAVGTVALGWTMAAVGLAVIAAGWWALVWYGDGLPMNVAPPAKLVTQGIYRMLPHPIYVGFSLMTAGYFMGNDLRAGFWLVTPCVALGCAAIVLGYERHDMNSILYNLILGPLLVRACTLCAPLPLIVGLYLIVGGMGRFIEEAHRGEPQTARLGGPRIYQWLALAGAVIGVFLTTIPGPRYTNHVEFVPRALAYAAVFGLFTALAMSVDLPDLPRRFSHLAPP